MFLFLLLFQFEGRRLFCFLLFCFTFGQLAHCTVNLRFFFPFLISVTLDVSYISFSLSLEGSWPPFPNWNNSFSQLTVPATYIICPVPSRNIPVTAQKNQSHGFLDWGVCVASFSCHLCEKIELFLSRLPFTYFRLLEMLHLFFMTVKNEPIFGILQEPGAHLAC